MSESPPLSVRGYARHRGVSHQAVMQAIKAGRLRDSLVRVGSGWKIADVARADAEWARKTDASKVPNAHRSPNGNSPALVVTAAETPTLAVSTALQKHWQAQQAELDFRQAAGQLVEAAAITARVVDVHVRCRTKLMGIPSKAKQALPHLSHADVLVLDTLIREALEDLATLPAAERTVA